MKVTLRARLFIAVLMLWCGFAVGYAEDVKPDLSGLATSSTVENQDFSVNIRGDYSYDNGVLTLKSGAAMVLSSPDKCFNKVVLDGYHATGSGMVADTWNGKFAGGTWTANGDRENHTTLTVHSGSQVTLSGLTITTTAATPKVVPEIRLGGTEFTAQVNQYKFDAPTLAIKDPSTGADITNRFQVNYFISGQGLADDGTTGKVDKDGKQYTEDPATGTTVTRLYGKVKIGGRAGKLQIAVAVAPVSQYAGQYGVGNAYYTITIPKVHATVSVSPRADMGVAVGQTVAVPSFTLHYQDAEGQEHTIIPSDENSVIAYTIDGGDHITYDAANKTITGKTAGTATIHYTITPTEAYANIFDALQQDVTVKVEQSSGKIATHMVFPNTEESVYRTENSVPLEQQIPVIYDSFGNDVTSQFSIQYKGGKSAEPINYTYTDPLSREKRNWLGWNTDDYARATNYYSGQRQYQLNGVPGDVIMVSSATSNNPLYDNPADATYTLHVLKRSLQVEITPDPSELNLPANFTYKFTDIFKVRGSFTDKDTNKKEYVDYGAMDYFVAFPEEDKGKVTLTLDGFPHDDLKTIYTDADGKKWILFKTTEGYGTDKTWMIKYLQSGTFNAHIVLVPWNHVSWDISDDIPVSFKITSTVPATLTATPSSQTVYVGDTPVKPIITVKNPALGDITSHYNLTYEVSDPDHTGTTVDASTGEIRLGGSAGTVTVTVKASGKNATEGYEPCDTTYTINIVSAATRFTYEIIKADSPADKDMGKMQITGAGDVPGGYVISGVPGLDVMFGKSDESGWQAYERNGRVVVAGGPVSMKSTDGEPQNGTYYVLSPVTNGFLTVDANYAAGNKVVLVGKTTEGNWYTEEYTPAANAAGEYTFRYPLMAGGIYWLYNEGNGASNEGLELHGINFLPSFIRQRSNTKAVTEATIFTNGYVGTLPVLAQSEQATVSYAVDTDEHATIDARTGSVVPVNPGSEKVTATVKSATKEGVYRLPSYALTVGAIPTYVVKDGEALSVGERLTTTNIPTRMFMTVGGWKDGSGPYVKYTYNEDGTISSSTSLLDSWKTAKYDLVGNSLDGFSYQSQGGQNATDEDVNPYNTDADAKHTYVNLPVRGAYLRFEPEESGTLMVYILQNGACDYDEDEPASASSYKALKYRPLFITDETGKNEDLDNNWTAIGGLKEVDSSNPNNNHRGRYTEGYFRTKMNDATVAALTGQTGELAFTWDSKFNNEKDKEALMATWRNKNAGDPEEIIRLENGGYTMVSKAYVRYAIHVKAGKSYYVFQNGSKLGFCGFAFIPENYSYDANNTEGWYTQNSETVELNDKATSYSPMEKENVTIKTNRTLKAGMWTSICLPFSVSETKFKETFGDDAKIITFSNVDKTNADSWVINFDQHVYHMIVAGQPYFIRPSKDITELQFDHVSLESSITGPVDGMSSEGFSFKGTFIPATVADGSYYLSKTGQLNHLVKPAGAPINGLRAYINNEGSTAQGAKMMMMWRDVDGDESGTLSEGSATTGIDDVTTTTPATGNKGIYNLQGQRLDKNNSRLDRLPKGVYIVDGRKVIVK